MTKSNYGCGVGLLKTSEKDPFYAECIAHDMNYELNHKGQQLLTRKEVDKLFYDGMMQRVQAKREQLPPIEWEDGYSPITLLKGFGSFLKHGLRRVPILGLNARAKMYYGLVKLAGGWYWNS
jgi:hypothetical protein